MKGTNKPKEYTDSYHVSLTNLRFENGLKRIDDPEEIEIIKATTSDLMLNVMLNNNPLYKIL